LRSNRSSNPSTPIESGFSFATVGAEQLGRHGRVEAIGQGVQAMGDEEAYY